LNEVANFYFVINRESEECDVCAGNGYHPDAQWVTESFYKHSTPFKTGDREIMGMFASRFQDREHTEVHGPNSFPSEEVLAKYTPEFRTFCEEMRNGDGCWNDKITQEEVDHLLSKDRLRTFTEGKWEALPRTAKEVNESQNAPGRGLDAHDGINRMYLISHRLEKYGVSQSCEKCEGHGHVYTEPEPYLGLVLWLLHPRKGASRGVHIKRIPEDKLPEVYAFLREAAERNADRFSKVPS
jgi:hypothetical protein